MRQLLAFLFGLLVLFGCSGGADESADAPRPEPRVAEIDLVIGEREGEEPYLFGDISGIAVDEQGRIFVADRQAHEIRVFSADGAFQFAIGGQGEGPGELNWPCCPAFGPDGHLWVRDVRNLRLNRYEVGADDAEPAGQVQMAVFQLVRHAPITFDEEGYLISFGDLRKTERAFPWVRRHRTLDDSTVHTQPLPEVPEDRIIMYETERTTTNQPFGAYPQHAHAPGGEWAFSIGDRYEIARYNAQGDTLHVIERSYRGAKLSDAERERAEGSLEAIAERGETSVADLPFGVPDRKPPIRGLFFDRDGRLWVRRSVPDSMDVVEADVYNERGELVDVVRWPKGIGLGQGVIRDSVVYGRRFASEDSVPAVVRLRY